MSHILSAQMISSGNARLATNALSIQHSHTKYSSLIISGYLRGSNQSRSPVKLHLLSTKSPSYRSMHHSNSVKSHGL